MKLALGLEKLITKKAMRSEIALLKEKRAKEQKLLNGRQIAWIIYKLYVRADATRPFLELKHLMEITLNGDDLHCFVTRWDTVLYGLEEDPGPKIKETLFSAQVRKSHRFQTQFTMYELNAQQMGIPKTYDKYTRWYASSSKMRGNAE